MASSLNGTGVAFSDSTTQASGKQAAKVWCLWNASGTIAGSYNVSSVTVNSTGNYTINFTNALANSNYAFVGCSQQSISNYTGIVTLASPASQTPTQFNTTGICVSVSESSNGSPKSIPVQTIVIYN